MSLGGRETRENMKIDFAIMGAQKAGTTALYDMLKQHPEVVVPSHTKEDNFFVDDEKYRIGEAYLQALYDNNIENKKVGYAYVNLMFNAEKVIPRLISNNPRLKLIFVLRNPVDRAYSAFWYMKMRGVEEAQTFEQAINREIDGLLPDTFESYNDLTYVKHGAYVDQIKPFVEAFGWRQIEVLFQEELRADHQAICHEVFDFIGVAERTFKVSKQESNAASQAKSSTISKLIYKDNPVKRIYKMIAPGKIQSYLGRTAVEKLKNMNRKALEYPEMNPATRELLAKYFKPYDERLERLLGRKLPWSNDVWVK